MGSQKNIKLLEEIRKWDCTQLISVLELNGLGDCCDAIRKKDIDGDSFLNLNETQLVFWRNLLNNIQVKRLWSCIQLARENPQQFIPQNTPASQTNKGRSLVTERIANLRVEQKSSPPISRKLEISENKPKPKPPPPIRRDTVPEITEVKNAVSKRVGKFQNQDNSQRTPKPPMPLKPTQSLNKFQNLPPKPNTSGNTAVQTGKIQNAIAEKLENLFGKNQPTTSIEQEQSKSPSAYSNNSKNVPVSTFENAKSEEDEMVDYENNISVNSYKNARSPLPNLTEARSMSFASTEDIQTEDIASDEEQTLFENNINPVPPFSSNKFQNIPQPIAVPPPPVKPIGKFKSSITDRLENILAQNIQGNQQEQVNVQDEEYDSGSDDEWDTSEDNMSPSPPLNTPPPPPRPAFLYSKKPAVPVPPIDISLRPPIPVPPSNTKPFIPFPQEPPLIPSDEGEYIEENIYEAEPEEENMYEAEPAAEEKSKFEPMSPIYKVPRPNPQPVQPVQPVKKEIPKPTITSRPLPQPPVEDIFPLPSGVVPIKRIVKPPIQSELPRPPVFLPPPTIPAFNDHDDVEYDSVDESDYRAYSWYQEIERRQAVRSLQGRPNGCFIVRPSRKPEIECAFSVICDGKVYNLLVTKENGKLQFGKNTFHKVTEIVERFQLYPLVLNGPNNDDVYVTLRF